MIIVASTPLSERATTPAKRAFFAKERIVIGRVSTADVVIEADTISRAAVHLLVTEERLTLVDRSDNGSYVNGVQGWGEREIREGDEVELPPYRLTFHRPTEADLRAALEVPREAIARARIHERLAILETARTARPSGHAKCSAEAYAEATGDPSVREAVDAYATVFRVAKSNDELLDRLRTIRDALAPVLGADHPFLGHVLLALVGHMREMPSANAERLAVYEHLREVAERRYGPDHGETLFRLADEAWLRWATGDEDAAYRDFERLLVGFLRLAEARPDGAYWAKIGEIIRPFGAIARARGDAERVLPYEEAFLAGRGDDARSFVEHLRLARDPELAFWYSARCLLRATEVVAPEWLPLARGIVEAIAGGAAIAGSEGIAQGEAIAEGERGANAGVGSAFVPSSPDAASAVSMSARREIRARIRAARGAVPSRDAEDEPVAEGLILEGLDELVTLAIEGRPAMSAREEIYGSPERPGNYGLAAISALESAANARVPFGQNEDDRRWNAQFFWQRTLFDALWTAREAARLARSEPL